MRVMVITTDDTYKRYKYTVLGSVDGIITILTYGEVFPNNSCVNLIRDIRVVNPDLLLLNMSDTDKTSKLSRGHIYYEKLIKDMVNLAGEMFGIKTKLITPIEVDDTFKYPVSKLNGRELYSYSKYKLGLAHIADSIQYSAESVYGILTYMSYIREYSNG